MPAAIAAQLLIERDATGVTRALVQSAIDALEKNPTAADRIALFRDIDTLAKAASAAKTPAQLLEILDSPTGRRYSLTSRVTPWNAAILRFADSSLDGKGVPGISDAKALDVLGQVLMSDAGPIKKQDLESLLAAIAIAGQTSPAQVIASAMPGTDQAAAQQLISSLVNGNVDPEATARFSQSVVDLATRELAKRTNEIAAISTARRAAEVFRGPDFAPLMRGEPDSRSILAGAQFVEILAQQLGDRQLSENIARAQVQVRSAMQIYEGVKLLAIASPGGSIQAAFSILSASNGLGPDSESAQTAALMAAVANLTALVTREFAKVNSKLDTMQASLRDISAQLKELKHVQLETLHRVAQLQGDVDALLAALPGFEQSMKALTVAVAESGCKSYRTGQLRTAPSEEEFYRCLNLYELLARERLTLASLGSGSDAQQAIIRAFPANDTSPMQERWAKAPLVAREAAQQLGLPAALRFAQGDAASRLGSGAFLTRGLEQYLGWIERFGGPYFERQALRTDASSLISLLADARLQGEFRDSLLPAKGERKAALTRFAQSLGEVSEDHDYQEATARVRAAAVRGVIQNVLKAHINEMKAKASPLPMFVTVAPCDGSPVNVSYSFSPQELVAKGVPEDVFRFATSVGTNGFSFSGASNIDIPMSGFYACLQSLKTTDIGMHHDYVIQRQTIVDMQIQIGNKDVCPPPHHDWYFNGQLGANKPSAPSAQTMEHDSILENVRKCFAGIAPEHREDWLENLANLYLEDGSAEYLAAAVASEVDSHGITEADVQTITGQTAARIAFLRGYLLFAYPSSSATPPPLVHALLDRPEWSYSAAEVLAGYKCFGLLERQRRAGALGGDLSDFDVASRCDKTPLVLDVGALLNFREHSEAMSDYLVRAMALTDWDTLEDGQVSQTTWVADRLQHFIEAGNTAAYWKGLPTPRF